ncbi:MAG: isoprenyl transferase [Bacillaceae bacterium]|nr:isoprenyl transferase [Bacillaceae bacterium]
MLNKIKSQFKKNERELTEKIQLREDNIPQHVAIIMDGNGRWAKQRGLPRVAGHRAGMNAIREVARAASELNIKIVTLYAFSTENWKRPREEVEYLMKLPQEFLVSELDELNRNNVQVRMVGSEDRLPEHTLEAVTAACEKTKHNTGLILNFALNYGSRAEILHTLQDIAREVKEGKLNPDEIDEQQIESRLETAGLPDPDLLIRTSGEIRLSNFMLWQLAYSELWFTDVYWPDFTREHFYEAISEYQRRSRRYGAI